MEIRGIEEFVSGGSTPVIMVKYIAPLFKCAY